MAGSWMKDWMASLTKELGEIEVDGYEVTSETVGGPVIWVTLKGAAEDTTAARQARQQILKIMDASIAKNSGGVPGLTSRVQSWTKGGRDVLMECTIWFP